MSPPKRYPEITPFSRAFAVAYRERMEDHAVTQMQLAAALARTQAYVSERISGRRALDTDDVDALAKLTGTDGRSLLIDLAHRAHTFSDLATLTELEEARRQRNLALAAKRGKNHAEPPHAE